MYSSEIRTSGTHKIDNETRSKNIVLDFNKIVGAVWPL
jgi:hypothetical protein